MTFTQDQKFTGLKTLIIDFEKQTEIKARTLLILEHLGIWQVTDEQECNFDQWFNIISTVSRANTVTEEQGQNHYYMDAFRLVKCPDRNDWLSKEEFSKAVNDVLRKYYKAPSASVSAPIHFPKNVMAKQVPKSDQKKADEVEKAQPPLKKQKIEVIKKGEYELKDTIGGPIE
jgi:hypothetical protein